MEGRFGVKKTYFCYKLSLGGESLFRSSPHMEFKLCKPEWCRPHVTYCFVCQRFFQRQKISWICTLTQSLTLLQKNSKFVIPEWFHENYLQNRQSNDAMMMPIHDKQIIFLIGSFWRIHSNILHFFICEKNGFKALSDLLFVSTFRTTG